jgi:hypothetical protein
VKRIDESFAYRTSIGEPICAEADPPSRLAGAPTEKILRLTRRSWYPLHTVIGQAEPSVRPDRFSGTVARLAEDVEAVAASAEQQQRCDWLLSSRCGEVPQLLAFCKQIQGRFPTARSPTCATTSHRTRPRSPACARHTRWSWCKPRQRLVANGIESEFPAVRYYTFDGSEYPDTCPWNGRWGANAPRWPGPSHRPRR